MSRTTVNAEPVSAGTKLRTLEIWIPGLPLGMNSFNRRGTRGRMQVTKGERDRAYLCSLKAVREKYRSGEDTWTGPTSIDFEIRTSRVLKDQTQAGAGVKRYQDGLCPGRENERRRAVLPLGDGHGTPYVWREPTQVRVKTRKEEGVLVTIKELP